MTKAERIKSVLVEFAGSGLSAREIAAEADASLSWTYEVLRRLRAEGFLAFDLRDRRGLPARARHFRALRSEVEAFETQLAQAEVELAEDYAETMDCDAEFEAWSRRAA